ncbi:uncharacterized protein LOC144636679 [Oculina patagonica]
MSHVASQHDGGLHGFNQCGLFIKPDYPYPAASPDGLFYCRSGALHGHFCRCHGLSIIEAKCPYLVRNGNLHVKETYNRVDLLEDFNGRPRLKSTHKYHTQMQAQMWFVGATHGYFIVWTQGEPLFYERVELDIEFCLNVASNITLFYKSFVFHVCWGTGTFLGAQGADK